MLLALLLAVTPADPLAAADARLATVAWRLQTANVELCPKRERLPGFTLHAIDQYPKTERTAIASARSLGSHPSVAAVVSGSEADGADLFAGDALIAIDGTPLPTAKDGPATYATVESAERALGAALKMPPAALTLVDGRELLLDGTEGCASRVQLLPSKGMNASADGTYVQLGGKLYDFVESDDELAAVVAHELAHNILGHDKRRPDEEFAADRLAVWLVARAGYEPKAIAPFWLRLGKRVGGTGLLSNGTHPRWSERARRIEAAVVEIAAQRATSRPLVPPSQP